MRSDWRESVGRVLAVTGLTFREAWRRKVVVAALVMTLGFLGLYATGLHFASKDIAASAQEGFFDRVLAAQLVYFGLFPASIIVGLMAVLSSAGSISGELDTGVLYGVLARPIRRGELVIGKFLGIGLMVGAYTVALSSAVVAFGVAFVDTPTYNVPAGLALLVLEPLILLAVALLGSARFSTIATGVLCVATYGLAFIGGMIEQIDALMENVAMQNIGIISSLVMPVDAVHRKGLSLLLPPGLVVGTAGPPIAGSATSAQPSTWMVVYAVLYALGALALATRVFAKRDL